MKILILIDKYRSAIDRLSQPIKELNPHLEIQVLPLHPKRPDLEQIDAVVKAFNECDILHVAYFKSGEKLKEFVDISKKTKLLCHYNPYSPFITKKKAGEGLAKNMVWDNEGAPQWNEMYDAIVVGNKSIHEDVPYAHLISYGIDLDFWTYNEDYTDDKTVNMTVARIESSKGVLEVAQATKELGYKFVLVGRISDGKYFEEVMKANPETVFKEDITDEELRQVYYESAIHVCNSKDNFESGTLPILESMACGTPVLTRNVGHVPDLYDGKNMEVRMGAKEDLKELKGKLTELMEGGALREKYRGNAWETAKNRSIKRYASSFEKLYYKILSDKSGMPFVSVITPTMDRPEALAKNLTKTLQQTYPNFEVVIIDSGSQKVEKVIEEVRKHTRVPIKYIRFDRKDEYSLAKARNLGIIDATGQLLVFCDERMGMREGSIMAFASKVTDNLWGWGVKDDYEKGFVENFSAVMRRDIIKYGMFNERVDIYGGMTQDIRTRFERDNQFMMVKCFDAKADSQHRGNSKASKRQSIIHAKDLLWEIYEK